jgi:protein-tyrosine kinase
MVRHYRLMAPGQDTQDDEAALTPQGSSDDGSDGPARGRTGHVPLFRPGQPLPAPAVTLDQRTGREIFAAPVTTTPLNPARVWESITEVTPDPDRLARNGLFAETERHPATQGFDMLRTRVLQAMAKHGWTRLAVTSPTHGCGKSFVAANLALSLARLPACRTVLIDLELRQPALAGLFARSDAAPLIEFLMGEQPLESHFRRLGRNLALALNGEPVLRAAELLQDPEFAAGMAAMSDLLQPDAVVMDTPPALVSDDVIALAGQAEAVLLVTDGTRTSPDEIAACERLFDGRLPLLGVVLNRAQDRASGRYRYGRRG